jgi:hypothetical protein
VIASFELAWEKRDRAALEALLAPDFEFCVLDPSLFAWLGGSCWGRSTELRFAANLFDPAYAGSVPPVHVIDLDLTVLEVVSVPGVHTVPVDCLITVLTGPSDGWRVDARLAFTLVALGYHGDLGIREIREVSALQPRGDDLGIPLLSWGELKALYD